MCLLQSSRQRLERDAVQLQLKIMFWKSLEQDHATRAHLKRLRAELKEVKKVLEA